MIKVALLVSFCCLLSGSCSSSELVERAEQLRLVDPVKLNDVDDKVRDYLNETLSAEAEAIELRLNVSVADFDADCNKEVEELGAACVACAQIACQENEVEENPDKFKAIVGKLKEGLKKFTGKIKDKLKKFTKKIGKTVKKVWRKLTRGISRVIRRTVRRFVSGTVRRIAGTIRRVTRVVRRIGRVIRRVGSAVRRIGRVIRRVIRFRVRLRRIWGKRNTDDLPACAMNCEQCRTLQSSNTEQICGKNVNADKLIARLNLVYEALNAVHDPNAPVIAKIELGKTTFWENNDMFFSHVEVTANIRGVPNTFNSSLPMPMFGDLSDFADNLGEQVWSKYQTAAPNPDVVAGTK